MSISIYINVFTATYICIIELNVLYLSSWVRKFWHILQVNGWASWGHLKNKLRKQILWWPFIKVVWPKFCWRCMRTPKFIRKWTLLSINDALGPVFEKRTSAWACQLTYWIFGFDKVAFMSLIANKYIWLHPESLQFHLNTIACILTFTQQYFSLWP